ncbi:UPF0280 family protein [Algicella marina]|uniref:UPF0280 family protein n=1 Tax=Algicella marina TaxID=2683284 RepID=A0A6P1T4Z3_9RHOB|nr:UPF0280 family protein [Algicella marina]QHQ37087.1 UPF0280 family protein [Algicella marina]
MEQINSHVQGNKLHLRHGPIELSIAVEAANPSDRRAAFAAAEDRFATILEELVGDLCFLRRPVGDRVPLSPVAERMYCAVVTERDLFLTPMAAVAGAVADEILDTMLSVALLRKALVNNGGDIAYFAAPGEPLRILMSTLAGERLGVANLPAGRGGVATSGWGGRSFSLGIADSVTVLAETAAEADAAATLVTNAVDLPGHPAVRRSPAEELSPESDLGARLVTTGCGRLTDGEIEQALAAGMEEAERLHATARLDAALLLLQGRFAQFGPRLIAQPHTTKAA